MLNKILRRDATEQRIKHILDTFEEESDDAAFKKGIYIYGNPGCGKTTFVMNLLKDMNCAVIKYDAGDVRNNKLIESLASNNMSDNNVLQLMSQRSQKIVIVMDEIDGMNNGDKGGITALIKLIRQKKTKKQKMEYGTGSPIICIGNYYMDKKIKELMKVCNVFELKSLTDPQATELMLGYVPKLKVPKNRELKAKILRYVQGDIRKLMFVADIAKNKGDMLTEELMDSILHLKTYNEDTKQITKLLLNRPFAITQHNQVMNDADRTTVALLYHENVVDMMNDVSDLYTNRFYLKMLGNMCFADYMDRITYQKQIWIFNEISSLMKTSYNNNLYHGEYLPNVVALDVRKQVCTEIRFTKVLTKYSTEYNNHMFIYALCQKLNTDKKDLITFFQGIRIQYGAEFYSDATLLAEVEQRLREYDISKLDIKRFYRFLDKNIKKSVLPVIDSASQDGEYEE